MRTLKTFALIALAAPLLAPAAELAPATLDAYQDYIRNVESEMTRAAGGDDRFLVLDESPSHAARARGGETVIEQGAGDGMIKIPGGLVHDWIGAVYVPGVTLDDALPLVQNYDTHHLHYGPEVVESKLLARDGDKFQIFYRLMKKKVITVVLDTEHEVAYERLGPKRARSISYTTRISQVNNAGKPNESIEPDGRGGGYLWRLYSYWKFEERDGGVYIELRAISLTRGIPTGAGWLVKPIVRDMPRHSIEATLTNTRDALAKPRA